jgi:hypothetical protein
MVHEWGEWGSPSHHMAVIVQPHRPLQAHSRTHHKSSTSCRVALAVIIPLPSLRPSHRISAPPRLELDPRTVVQAAAATSEEHEHEDVKGRWVQVARPVTLVGNFVKIGKGSGSFVRNKLK